MKISFTGTGCSGKSTLLKMCQEYYGDKFQYVTEVTRPLARKGFKINEEGDSATQRAIIDAHIENNKLDDVIMDRCIVDGYVYTEWLFTHQKVDEKTYEYAANTLNKLINDIDIIFYCCPLQMEDDGQRSTSKKFQSDINNIMTMLLYQDDWNSSYNNMLITLEDKDVDKRFKDIKIAIEEHEHSTTR
jgi:dephospho-CoA kinase